MSIDPDLSAEEIGLPIGYTDVVRDRLLVVEGDFDFGFLRELLDRNGRRKVQILPVDGRKKISARTQVRILADDKDQLRWIGVARDADADASAALRSLQGTLRQLQKIRGWIPIPDEAWRRMDNGSGRSVTLFVFPEGEASGDIERWIWSALKDDTIASCVDRYVSCLSDAEVELPRVWKTRVYAYLSALARPEMPLRAAARAQQIPMGSPVFARFLSEIPPDHEIL